MHFPLWSRSLGIAALLSSVGALGACASDGADGDEALFITRNVGVAAACTFTGDPSEPFLPHGSLDVLAEGYLLHPQVKSRILSTTGGSDDPQRTVLLESADIDISFPDSTLFSATELKQLETDGVTKFKQLTSGPVTPNGTTDTEVTAVQRNLIDAVVAKKGAGTEFELEMLVGVTLKGDLGGSTVSSQRFDYPITLSTGLASNVGACPPPAGVTIQQGNACNPFQDGAVTCCTQANGALQCPAVVVQSN